MKTNQMPRLVLIVLLLSIATAMGQTSRPVTLTIGNEMEVGRLIVHQSAVTAVAVSADGHVAISGSRDGLLCVWEPQTSTFVRLLKGHKNVITAVAITPDGRRAVSVGNDARLCVWDLTAGKLISLSQFNWVLSSGAISDDGKIAAGGNISGTVRMIDVDQDAVKGEIDCDGDAIRALTLSPDGSRVAFSRFARPTRPNDAFGDTYVAIHKTADGSHEADIQWMKRCFHLKFVNNGKQLQWMGASDSYGAVDADTLQPVAKVEFSDSIPYVCDAPADSSFFVIARGVTGVAIARPNDAQQQHEGLPANARENTSIAVTPDGRFVLVGGAGATTNADQGFAERHDGCVLVMDLTRKSTTREFKVRDLVVSDDGSTYTLFGQNGISFFDVAKGVEMPANSANGRPSAASLLTADRATRIVISRSGINVIPMEKDGRKSAVVPIHYERATTKLISPDQHLLVIGRTQGDTLDVKESETAIVQDVQVIDLVAGRRLADLATGPTPISGMRFAPDGRLAMTFAALSDQPDLERSFQIWDVAQAKQLLKVPLDGDYRLPIWIGKDVVAAVKQMNILRWNAQSGQVLPPIQLRDPVYDLCCDSTGAYLLASHAGGSIDYLAAKDGRLLASIQVADAKKAKVKFLTNGRAVAIVERANGSRSVIPLNLPK
ncbi:hypothetical protein BH10PLA1_BH10PLA1_04400 [soil metagenome]